MSEKHHWVPQSYLRAFRDPSTPEDKAKIFVFGRKANLFGEPRRQHVKEVFCEGDLYARQTPAGKNYSLEKALAEKIDGKYPKILKKIESRQPLTKEERTELCMFMAAQLVRTPRMRDSINDFTNQLLGWAKQMEAVHRKRSASAEEIKDWAKNAHAEHIATATPEIAKIFHKMKIGFGCAPITGMRFITSDCPCYLRSHNQSAGGMMKGGLLYNNTEIYLPISPTTVAMLSWVNCRGYFRMTNKEVEEQNRMTRGFCHKEFASPSAKAKLYWFSRYPLDPIMVAKILVRRFTEWSRRFIRRYVNKS